MGRELGNCLEEDFLSPKVRGSLTVHFREKKRGPEVNRVSSSKKKDGHEDEENDDLLEFASMKSKRMN